MSDIVPRRMLELCKDTLLRCLGERVTMAARITELETGVEAEIERLEALLEGRRGDQNGA